MSRSRGRARAQQSSLLSIRLLHKPWHPSISNENKWMSNSRSFWSKCRSKTQRSLSWKCSYNPGMLCKTSQIWKKMRLNSIKSTIVRLMSRLLPSTSWKKRKSWNSVMLFLDKFPLKNPAFRYSAKKKVVFLKTMITIKTTVTVQSWCLKTDYKTYRLVNLSSRNI